MGESAQVLEVLSNLMFISHLNALTFPEQVFYLLPHLQELMCQIYPEDVKLQTKCGHSLIPTLLIQPVVAAVSQVFPWDQDPIPLRLLYFCFPWELLNHQDALSCPVLQTHIRDKPHPSHIIMDLQGFRDTCSSSPRWLWTGDREAIQ